ncbi:unnamed protein product [Trichogramma brassicae]|uniref:Uncharacterized protein n=1 Tax=Trichogramma brassicae TaxID=86971 RepID=A0A6H5HVT7_9HYME|nr:unnamed protein product [Trichogramma brassicae]
MRCCLTPVMCQLFNGRQGSSIVDLTFVCEDHAYALAYCHGRCERVVHAQRPPGHRLRVRGRRGLRAALDAPELHGTERPYSRCGPIPCRRCPAHRSLAGPHKNAPVELMVCPTHSACDAYVSKASLQIFRELGVLWTADIADLRRSCLWAHTLAQIQGPAMTKTHRASNGARRFSARGDQDPASVGFVDSW